MLGISYGEIFIIIGAAAALIGPKDLPRIARTAGRLAGRSIGYVQLARGHFDNIMQQTQAQQVHKELQEAMSQLEAIRHEIRTMPFLKPGPYVKPGPLSGSPADDSSQTSPSNGASFVETTLQQAIKETPKAISTAKDHTAEASASFDLHNRAVNYAKLAESATSGAVSVNNEILSELADESGIVVLPVSAKSAGLLPPTDKDGIKGSDIVLEAILEADVAHHGKDFFAQPQNHIKSE